MKLSKIFTAITAGTLAIVASAHGQDHWNDPLNGFYANAAVGVNILGDIKSSGGDMSFKTSTDVGERISLGVGYMVPLAKSTSIGLEFETGALVNTLGKVTATEKSPFMLGSSTTTDDLNGYYYQLPFLVNGVLVCHAVPKFTFYVGIGGGGVYSRMHLHRIDDIEVDEDADETDGAFQAMGGVRYQLAPNQEVGLSYKYLAVFCNNVSFGNNTDTVQNHAVMATYTFHF